MSRESGKKGSYHHGDLRRALLDAALALIEEKGIDGLSLRAVARRAGVSHMAPYHHFDDRAALVAAVAEEGFMLLREAMHARMEDAPDPPSQLRESGLGYVLFAAEHEAHFRVMFSPELADKRAHPDLQAASAATYEVLSAAIVRCQDIGLVRDEDPSVLTQTAWALVHGLAMLVIDGYLGPSGDHGEVESLAHAVTTVLWTGLHGNSEVE